MEQGHGLVYLLNFCVKNKRNKLTFENFSPFDKKCSTSLNTLSV